jgi:hypothetical protein
METIINYLENMFKNLPKTNQVIKLKDELLANMEDKYHELKQNGKSENEAIGIVISEFGNIDELMEEFGIDQERDERILPSITDEEVEHFLNMNKKYAKMIGFGVALCILAPVFLIIFSQIIDDSVMEILGLIPLFLFIAVAVSLFIFAGTGMEKYKFLEYGVNVPSSILPSIKQQLNEFRSTFSMYIMSGVVLCVLSPITLIILSNFHNSASYYGVVILLSMVALAVYLFIYAGMVKDGYRKLLNIGKYTKAEKEQNRVIAAVSAIVWPFVVCIFLISGFVFNMWHINWLIFPVAGLLFAMFSGTYKVLKAK